MATLRSPVVVTGAAGRLGSRLVPWLEAEGRDVRPVDVHPFDHPRAVVADLTEPGEWDWMSGARAVVHLAGNPDSGATWDEVERPNVEGTRLVLEAARRHGVERVVIASSVWAMRARWERGGVVHATAAEPGDNAYGQSKARAETLAADCATDGLSVVVLRIGGRASGDERPWPINEWEDSCWLGWHDFLRGVTRAMDARVRSIATVNLVSRNRARRWSLAEGRAIGFRPRERYHPMGEFTVRERIARRLG